MATSQNPTTKSQKPTATARGSLDYGAKVTASKQVFTDFAAI